MNKKENTLENLLRKNPNNVKYCGDKLIVKTKYAGLKIVGTIAVIAVLAMGIHSKAITLEPKQNDAKIVQKSFESHKDPMDNGLSAVHHVENLIYSGSIDPNTVKILLYKDEVFILGNGKTVATFSLADLPSDFGKKQIYDFIEDYLFSLVEKHLTIAGN